MKHGTVGWGTIEKKVYPIAKGEIKCKWLIVGAGITGLSTAYFLLKQGEEDIVIIEKNTVGSGSTGHSAGMLVFEPEQASWEHYVKVYGRATAKVYYEAQQTTLRTIKRLILDNDIKCEFEEEDLLLLANTNKEHLFLIKDFSTRKSIHERARFFDTTNMRTPLKKRGYLFTERIDGNISVNPLLFARGFAHYLHSQGVRIYEETELKEISSTTALTDAASITFKKTVTARGTYEKNSALEYFLTTICLTRKLTKRELTQTGFFENDMFSDNEGHSFFYGKVTLDRRLMIGYGDLKQNGSIKQNYTHAPHLRAIERFLKKTSPATPLALEYSWSAPYAISKRDVPVISLEAYGANINGGGTQVVSMVAAEVATGLLLKKKHPLKKLLYKK